MDKADDSFADALWYCPFCNEIVDDGLACGMCGSWYHYTCEKFKEPDIMINKHKMNITVGLVNL